MPTPCNFFCRALACTAQAGPTGRSPGSSAIFKKKNGRNRDTAARTVKQNVPMALKCTLFFFRPAGAGSRRGRNVNNFLNDRYTNLFFRVLYGIGEPSAKFGAPRATTAQTKRRRLARLLNALYSSVFDRLSSFAWGESNNNSSNNKRLHMPQDPTPRHSCHICLSVRSRRFLRRLLAAPHSARCTCRIPLP